MCMETNKLGNREPRSLENWWIHFYYVRVWVQIGFEGGAPLVMAIGCCNLLRDQGATADELKWLAQVLTRPL